MSQLNVNNITKYTGGEVVVNDASEDVDFRVESDGNANMLTVNAGSNIVGIAADPDLGIGLHIKESDSGADVSGSGNNLVIEESTDGGMSILNGTGNVGSIFFGDSGDNDIGAIRYDHSDNSLQIKVNAAERMRIITSGNVGIGVTDPDALLEVNGKFKVDNSMSGDNIMLVVNSAADGYGPFFKAGGTGTASQFVFRFAGYDGTERMRMDGNGRVLVNSAATFDGDAQFQIKSANAGAECLSCHAHTTGNSVVNFLNGSGSEVGYITANASTTTYSTSSDYRLKENETSITDGIERVKQLKPYRFNFKAEADKTMDGFFAHEVSSIVPEAISGEKDSTETRLKTVKKADGDLIGLGIEEADWEQGKIDETYPSDSTWTASEEIIDAQGIDQAKLVPLLTSALQEAITKIETLETKVTALENA